MHVQVGFEQAIYDICFGYAYLCWCLKPKQLFVPLFLLNILWVFADPTLHYFVFTYLSWTPFSPMRVAMHVLTPICCCTSRAEFFCPSWQLARLGGGWTGNETLVWAMHIFDNGFKQKLIICIITLPPFFTIYNYYYYMADNVWSDLNPLSLSLFHLPMPLHAYILMTKIIFSNILYYIIILYIIYYIILLPEVFCPQNTRYIKPPHFKRCKINVDINHILIYIHIYNIQWNT